MRFGNSISPPKHLIAPVELLFNRFSPFPKKILLALSGGPDSKALLHVCLYLMKKEPAFVLGVAHVDHRWRKESEKEALLLKEEVEELHLPFHLKVLEPKKKKGNLEKHCREMRLKFFDQLCQIHGYEMVLLAHQRDDLAETVLKRILEGASFFHAYGMKKMTHWNGLNIGRPWLEVPKTALIDFLESSNISYFKDVTNENPKFLRGKMRTSLFPFFEAEFGKSIIAPLARLSQESEELTVWMKKQFHGSIEEGKLSQFHLNLAAYTSSFEVRFLLREWLAKLKLELSWEAIDLLKELVLIRAVNRKVKFDGGAIHVDRCVERC